MKNNKYKINQSDKNLDDKKFNTWTKDYRLKDNIVSLNLSSNSLTDESIKSITSFKNLTSLNLSFNEFTDKSAIYLKTLPKLKFLNLGSNQLTNKSLQHLAEIKNLRKLTLDRNKEITSIGTLKTNPNIQFLDVRHTKLDDEGLNCLEKTTKLWHLDVGNTQLTKEGLIKFFQNKNSIFDLLIYGCYFAHDRDLIVSLKKYQDGNLQPILLENLNLLNNHLPYVLSNIILNYISSRTDLINPKIEIPDCKTPISLFGLRGPEDLNPKSKNPSPLPRKKSMDSPRNRRHSMN